MTRKFIFSSALALAALLLGVWNADAATGPGYPIVPQSKEYKLAIDTSGTTTPVHIIGYSGFQFQQYRIFVTCSSATATFSIALGNSSASVATVVAPTTVTPQLTTTYPCGNPIEIISGPAQAWVNGIVSSGTATILIEGGEGL